MVCMWDGTTQVLHCGTDMLSCGRRHYFELCYAMPLYLAAGSDVYSDRSTHLY